MIGLRQAAPAERLSCQTLHSSTYMLCTPFNTLAVPPSELSLTNVTLNKQCILRHRLMVHSTTGDKGVKQPLKTITFEILSLGTQYHGRLRGETAP